MSSKDIVDTDNLTYCGLGLYFEPSEYRFFEKQADTLVELNDIETDAERRFVKRHLNDKEEGDC